VLVWGGYDGTDLSAAGCSQAAGLSELQGADALSDERTRQAA
jgi:hypothetical protein